MNRSKWLMLGAGAVAIVRYVGVFLHAEGGAIHGLPWEVANGASGVGMAVLEAVGIWHCWGAWAAAQPGRMRDTLMVLILGIFASITVMVAPYVYSASQVGSTSKTLIDVSAGSLWVWSIAITVAPLLIMAGAGLADTLQSASTDARQAHSEAGEVQQVVGAMLTNFEAKIGATMSGYATVADVSKAFDRMEARLQRAQPSATSEQPAAQLTGGMEWSLSNLQSVVAQRPNIGATEARNLFSNPPTRQAVAKALAQLQAKPVA